MAITTIKKSLSATKIAYFMLGGKPVYDGNKNNIPTEEDFKLASEFWQDVNK